MIKNLVFSGGGVKCISYIGILKYLEKENILKDISGIAGTSGGAIFAFIILLGYTYNDLLLLINGLNFEEVRDITSENLFQFFSNFGIDTGNKLTHLIKLLLNKKLGNGSENITFKELFNKTNVNLVITGTCLDTRKIEYFNHINTPNMKLLSALRITFSIPIVYNKVNYNNKIYVDGGLIDNLPIDIFKDDILHTLAFYITTNTENSIDIDSIDNYMLSILLTLNQKIDFNTMEKYKDNIVVIETDISPINFKLSIDKKNDIIDIGYKSIQKYFFNKNSNKINNNIIKVNIKKININTIQDINNSCNKILSRNLSENLKDVIENINIDNSINIINKININKEKLYNSSNNISNNIVSFFSEFIL